VRTRWHNPVQIDGRIDRCHRTPTESARHAAWVVARRGGAAPMPGSSRRLRSGTADTDLGRDEAARAAGYKGRGEEGAEERRGTYY